MSNVERKILEHKWFYKYQLPSGAQTEAHSPDHIMKIHDTRLEMLCSQLDNEIGNSEYHDKTFIDFASHEGFFAQHLAKRGAKSVLGLEARADSVEKAQLIKKIYKLKNLDFAQQNVAETNLVKKYDPADYVLVFGLIYHVEDPIGILRNAVQLSKKAVLVETQVVPNMSGNVDWGSVDYHKDLKGCFGIIDEREEIDYNTEASVTGICLCPSIEGLCWILESLGCKRVEVIQPPSDGYEQLVKKRRVMVIGHK